MRITLCLTFVLLVATSACSSSESEDIYGVWITPGNPNYMSFNEDDSWSFAGEEEGSAYDQGPTEWGTFTFDGGLLTFSTHPDSRVCYDATGTYEAAFTAEGDLELNVVEDPCGGRAGDLTGTLVPYSP